MGTMTALPEIRPISDLRTKLADIEDLARDTCEPIVLTRNGLPALVVMDSDAFEEHLRHERSVRKLREAELEEKYRRESYSHEYMKTRVQQIIEVAEKIDALD